MLLTYDRWIVVREQVVVAAGITVDAGEAVVRVAALDETFDHLRLDRAPQSKNEPRRSNRISLSPFGECPG